MPALYEFTQKKAWKFIWVNCNQINSKVRISNPAAATIRNVNDFDSIASREFNEAAKNFFGDKMDDFAPPVGVTERSRSPYGQSGILERARSPYRGASTNTANSVAAQTKCDDNIRWEVYFEAPANIDPERISTKLVENRNGLYLWFPAQRPLWGMKFHWRWRPIK